MYLIKPAPLMIKTINSDLIIRQLIVSRQLIVRQLIVRQIISRQLIVSIRHGSKLTAELRIADCKFCEDQKRFLPHTDRLTKESVSYSMVNHAFSFGNDPYVNETDHQVELVF